MIECILYTTSIKYKVERDERYLPFIIHPCDPTVVICYLIRPCDIAACITYLVSHSSSLSCNTVIKKIFQVGCIINTKLPSCVDIIRRTSLSFHSWCPESTRPTDSCFHGTSCENLMMYGGLYQHTRVVLYLYRVRSLALQPLSAGNSAEFSQADNSRTIQRRAMNLTSLDSLGSWESIYVYIKKIRNKHE